MSPLTYNGDIRCYVRTMSAALDTLLIAGAHAYAEAFGRVPPVDESTMRRELESAPSEIQTSVTEAVFHCGYDKFRSAVQRALVKVVVP